MLQVGVTAADGGDDARLGNARGFAKYGKHLWGAKAGASSAHRPGPADSPAVDISNAEPEAAQPAAADAPSAEAPDKGPSRPSSPY